MSRMTELQHCKLFFSNPDYGSFENAPAVPVVAHSRLRLAGASRHETYPAVIVRQNSASNCPSARQTLFVPANKSSWFPPLHPYCANFRQPLTIEGPWCERTAHSNESPFSLGANAKIRSRGFVVNRTPPGEVCCYLRLRPVRGMTNPYGDGFASEKIVQVLTTVPLAQELLMKRHAPLPAFESTGPRERQR
jgi:hypothetical protein